MNPSPADSTASRVLTEGLENALAVERMNLPMPCHGFESHQRRHTQNAPLPVYSCEVLASWRLGRTPQPNRTGGGDASSVGVASPANTRSCARMAVPTDLCAVSRQIPAFVTVDSSKTCPDLQSIQRGSGAGTKRWYCSFCCASIPKSSAKVDRIPARRGLNLRPSLSLRISRSLSLSVSFGHGGVHPGGTA